MPVHPVKGQPGCYQWGDEGKVYCGQGAKEKAEAQGIAIYSSGYKGEAEMEMVSSDYQESDARWWLYHTWKTQKNDLNTIYTYEDRNNYQIWILINPYMTGGVMTFICTTNTGDAKQKCLNWIRANTPKVNGKYQYEARKKNENSANNGNYFSIEIKNLTYQENKFARSRIERFSIRRAEDNQKKHQTIDDVNIGDVFRFGDGWEKFVLKSKVIDNVDYQQGKPIKIYKIIFDPYVESPVSNIEALISEGAKIRLWTNPRLEIFNRRRSLKKNAETFEANDMVKERYFDKQIKKYIDKWDWTSLSLNPALTPAIIEKYEGKLSWNMLSLNDSLTPALIEKYEDKWNWNYISQNPALTPALIDKYKDKLTWRFLSRNPSLTPSLIEKYEDKLDWPNLSFNPSLTPALIDKYIDKLNWTKLSQNPALTPAFIEKYEDKWNWKYLSENPALAPTLIDKYIDKLQWVALSRNPALTPAFIGKYKDKMSWSYLSRNPALTPALIEKYKDKLDWSNLSFNPSLTPALIDKYIDKLNWTKLSQNPALNPAFIEKHKDKLRWMSLSSNPALFGNLHVKNAETFEANDMVKERYFDKQIKKYEDKWDWYSLSLNPALTPALIEKYEGKWSWDMLSLNPSLTPALIEKYEDEWNWRALSQNPSLTPAFIEKYEDKVNWMGLSENPALTPALIEKYEDEWNWKYLSENPALTPALIEKYKDKLNWKLLSQNSSLTPSLIEKYEDKLDWKYLSQNHALTPALIEEYKDEWNWHLLSRNLSLTPSLIEKYIDGLNWSYLSRNPSVTPAIIEKYKDKDKWDWGYLSQNSLTPALIEKYIDKVNWSRLSDNPYLTPALIGKYKRKWNWKLLSQNPALFGNLHVKNAETFESESSKKPSSVKISRSSNSEKKLMAVFEDSEGKKIKTTHFGQRGAEDYTKHDDKERMQRYLERHGGGTTTSTKEDWKDPTTAGALSRWILWNKPSLSGSFADYKRRFGLKGSINVSKSAEERKCKSCEKPATTVVQEGSFCYECLPINLGAETFEAPQLDSVIGDGVIYFDPASPTGIRYETLYDKNGAVVRDEYPQYDEIKIPERFQKIMSDIGTEKFYWVRTQGSLLWIMPEFFIEDYPLMTLFDTKSLKTNGYEKLKCVPATAEEVSAWKENKTGDKLEKFYENGLTKIVVRKFQLNPLTLEMESLYIKWFLPFKLFVSPFICGSLYQRKGDSSKPVGFSRQDIENSALKYNSVTEEYFLGNTKYGFNAERELSPAQKSLDKWTKEDWGTKSGKPSTQGRKATGERYLPRKAREALTDKEYARTSAKKRKDSKKGKQFSPQPDDVEEKVAKYRSETFEANDMVKERYFDKQIKKYKDKLNWIFLSENPALTPALIEKYEDEWDWNILSENPSLTPALIEKYEDEWDWVGLSQNPALTPALIEKYKDKLTWRFLSRNPSLTPSLIEKYEDKWNWKHLSENPALAPTLIDKYIDKLQWGGLSRNPSLTPSLIEKYKDKLSWNMLSDNPALTPALIEKYIDKLDWIYLSLNPSLTPAFIEKHKDKLNWRFLTQNPSLTPALIEKYKDKLYRIDLARNPSLTPALIEKYKDELEWDYLSKNPALFGNLHVKNAETFEAIDGKGSKARFTDQPDSKTYRDTGLRQKARNDLLKGTKGGKAGQWSARKAQMAATKYRKSYENKYGKGKNPYF